MSCWSPNHEPTSFLIPKKGFPDEFTKSVPRVKKLPKRRLLEQIERSFLESFPYFYQIVGRLSMPYVDGIFVAWLYRKCIRYHIIKGRHIAFMVAHNCKDNV
jgi:hypothetical protein